jgi:MscS family membrane protein
MLSSLAVPFRSAGPIFRRKLCYGARLVLLAAVALANPGSGRAAPKYLPDKEEPDVGAGLDKLREPLDRSTPRRAFAALLDACAKGRWERAEHLLNLGDVPPADRRALAPVLARQLCEVLRVGRPADPGSLDDTPVGPLSDDRPRNYSVVATVPGPGGGSEIWLRRFRDAASGQQLWLLTRKTVSEIPGWYRSLVKKERSQRPAVEQVNRLGPLPAGLSAENPRAAMQSFRSLTGAGRFSEAARLLDLSQLAPADHPSRGPGLARRLSIVLGRIHPGGYGGMSNDPQGAPERDTPLDEETVARATIDGQQLSVRLARYPRLAGSPIWLFSATTVGDIDTLYDRFGYGWAGDHLPPLFIEWQLLGVQLWQWLGMGLALTVALLLGYFGAFVLRRLLLRLSSATRWSWDDVVVAKLRGPLWIGMAVLLFVVQLPFLALAAGPRGLLLTINRLLAIVALGWFLVRIVDALGEHVFAFFKGRGDEMGMAMVPVARKILKPIIIAIIGVVALQNIGMNVSGLLAGLGIGGLAIALAGKNTLENLFGSLVISFDRPFRIGDFIRLGDLVGTVEDLGLRSTRVRTLDRTVVTIPNAQMADAKVENFSRRDRMRLHTTLGVQYDTQPDQLRFIIDEIKRYLLAHPRVWQESFSVRFTGYGAFSLDIEVMCWVSTAEWAEFTGIREAILMELGNIVERAGAVFAYPSQTVYTGEATGADAKRARHAAATLAARPPARELTQPALPAAVREAHKAPPPQS